jgi:hypothetical protein
MADDGNTLASSDTAPDTVLSAPSPPPTPKEAVGGPYSSYGDPRAPGWFNDNITQVESPSGAKFSVNKQAAPAFQGFLTDLHALGYTVDPKTSGGYNLRNITGGTTLSPHAYGVAIDINPSDNPYSRDSKGGTLKTDLPPNVGQLAAKWGLDWGGNWTSLKDPMHFEYRGGVAPDQTPTMMAARQTPTSNAGMGGSAPTPAAPVATAAVSPSAAAVAPNAMSSLAPYSGANLAAMSPYQRMVAMQQLRSLFTPPAARQQVAQAAGPQTGGVDASIPLMAGRV